MLPLLVAALLWVSSAFSGSLHRCPKWVCGLTGGSLGICFVAVGSLVFSALPTLFYPFQVAK